MALKLFYSHAGSNVRIYLTDKSNNVTISKAKQSFIFLSAAENCWDFHVCFASVKIEVGVWNHRSSFILISILMASQLLTDLM